MVILKITLGELIASEGYKTDMPVDSSGPLEKILEWAKKEGFSLYELSDAQISGEDIGHPFQAPVITLLDRGGDEVKYAVIFRSSGRQDAYWLHHCDEPT